MSRLEQLKALWLEEQECLLLTASESAYAPSLIVLDAVARLELNISAITRLIDRELFRGDGQPVPSLRAESSAG